MGNIPTFIERNPDVIMAECKADLEKRLGRPILPAQDEQLFLNYIVYREVLLCERFNSGMAQMLPRFSNAPVLDYLAELVAVERLPADYATCTVRFSLVEGHGNVIIPVKTRVSTSDGVVIFATLEEIVIQPNTATVDVEVMAQTAGRSGNGYPAGAVNTILDPLAFVSGVGNVDETAGGSDTESDESLRERMRLAPSQFSTAGPTESYRFHAMSANTSIIDVSVTSHTPGTVMIAPLTKADETPEQILNDVYGTCNAMDVRPLSDTVVVVSPAQKDYMIAVEVELFNGLSAIETKAVITKALQVYVTENRAKLGRDIIRSQIGQLCRVEGVYDAKVLYPAENIVVSDEEFAHCTQITVDVTGFNHG